MQFDLLSDVHLDETLKSQSIAEFVKELLPENPSTTLVFAGDFGYHNDQNVLFLKELTNYYATILYIYGNNDIKIQLDSSYPYNDVSHRVLDFEQMVSALPNVYRLHGTTVTVDGITFGGCDLFYDFDTLQHQFGSLITDIYHEWESRKLHLKHKGWIDDPLIYAQREKEKLEKILSSSDVIITHGPPDFLMKKEDTLFGFFRFSAKKYESLLDGKTWCFGHQHHRCDRIIYRCRFINACYVHYEQEKIQTIHIKKT